MDDGAFGGRDGSAFRLSGWSYDQGETTALVYPEECDPQDQDKVGAFHTSEVIEIIDEESGGTLFSKA